MALFKFVPTNTLWGGFEIPTVQGEPKVTRAVRARITVPAGKPGVYSQGPLPAEKRISVSCRLFTTPGQTIDDAVMELRAGLPIGPNRQLFTRADQAFYWPCEVESLTQGDSSAAQWINFDIVFLCPDGLYYRTAVSSAALNGGANVYNTIGTWEAAPVITLNITAAPAGSAVTITRDDGAFLTLRPSMAGQWVIDALQETVTDPNGADGFPLLLPTSQLLTLRAPGNTTLTLTTSGGATLNAGLVAWHERYE